MTKVVYNNAHSSFALSDQAVGRYAELKGLILYPDHSDRSDSWGIISPPTYWTVPIGERTSSLETQRNDLTFSPETILRHDPTLVQVVEEIGCAAASGGDAELAIREIADGLVYRIDEYDGLETVMTPDDYVWIDPSAEGTP